jgi:hypothetical protein
MATSTFQAYHRGTMDIVDQNSVIPTQWDVGGYYLGSTKLFFRRTVVQWNIFGPAVAGRPLTAADEITACTMYTITDICEGAPFTCELERITRNDIDPAYMSWTNYRSATPWTAGGGDVATPPAKLTFTGPTVQFDPFLVDVTDYAIDAAENRNGLVILRIKQLDEAPGATKWWAADDTTNAPIHLIIEYTGQEVAAIDDPTRAGGMLARNRPARVHAPQSPVLPRRGATPRPPVPPRRPARR